MTGLKLERSRRAILRGSARLASVLAVPPALGLLGGCDMRDSVAPGERQVCDEPVDSHHLTLFLGGDIMTARGIDQILPHPGNPTLYEMRVRNALDYVALAERGSGAIRRPVDFAYVWGDALAVIDGMKPHLGIASLETSVTISDSYWPGKGIHYRMHPDNIGCLSALGLDCCTLANNHVLDWGYEGLDETLQTLRRSGFAASGAGTDENSAVAPAVLEGPSGSRVLVFSLGLPSSGIPSRWAATPDRPGVNLLSDLDEQNLEKVAGWIARERRARDIIVASIHWGANWGYEIPGSHQRFARQLIDHAGVDVIHGHSSHHPLGIEVYKGRPIIYGCGDLLNDYEGIRRYAKYRADLVLMYFPTIDTRDGHLVSFNMVPMQIKRLRLNRVSAADFRLMAQRLNREGEMLGTQCWGERGDRLKLTWSGCEDIRV